MTEGTEPFGCVMTCVEVSGGGMLGEGVAMVGADDWPADLGADARRAKVKTLARRAMARNVVRRTCAAVVSEALTDGDCEQLVRALTDRHARVHVVWVGKEPGA